VAWLADRLQMGTRSYLTHLLYWRHRKQHASQLEKRNTMD